MSRKKEKRIKNQGTLPAGRQALKIWFWSLVMLFVLGLFSYGYLVRGVIVNIVARQNIGSELSFLNSKVSDLESEYIKAKNDITLEKAHDLGFVVVSSQKFVTRNTNNPGLSVITNGI